MKKTLTALFLLIAATGWAQDSLKNASIIGQSTRNQKTGQGLQVGFVGSNDDTCQINTKFQYLGSTPSAGKVLTSDANGFATWSAVTGTAWGLNGNSGDNASFLGTTGSYSLRFYTNNVRRMFIDSLGNYFRSTPSTRGYTAVAAAYADLTPAAGFGISGHFLGYSNGTMLSDIHVGDSRGIGNKSNISELNVYNLTNGNAAFTQSYYDSLTQEYSSLQGIVAGGRDRFIQISNQSGIRAFSDTIGLYLSEGMIADVESGVILNRATGITYKSSSDTKLSVDTVGLLYCYAIKTSGHTVDSVSTAGSSINIKANEFTIVKSSGTVTTLTIVFPATPSDHDLIRLKFTQAVTSLTLDGNGKDIPGGGLTSATNGMYTEYFYDGTTGEWY